MPLSRYLLVIQISCSWRTLVKSSLICNEANTLNVKKIYFLVCRSVPNNLPVDVVLTILPTKIVEREGDKLDGVIK